MARYIIQNTLWWVGVSGLDGIRQDTLPYVHRRFWRDWMAAIKKEYPDLRGGRGALRRRPRPRRPSSRAASPASTGSTPGSTPSSTSRSTSRSATPSRRDESLREAREDAGPRPPVPRRLGARDLPRPPRRAALHERAGGDGRPPCRSAFTFLATARGHPARLLRRRDRAAGRRQTPTTAATSPGASRATRGTPSRPRVARPTRKRSSPTSAPCCGCGRRRRRSAAGGPSTSTSPTRRGSTRASSRGRPSSSAINTGDAAVTLDLAAAPAGLADGARLRDRVGALGEAVVAGRPPEADPAALPHRGCSCRRSNDPLDLSGIIHEVS